MKFIYPVLFAAALVLWVAATNPGQYRLSDLGIVLVAVVAVCAPAVLTVFLVLRALDHTGRAAPLAAALVMLVVSWCFYYFPAQHALSFVSGWASRDPVLVPIGILFSLAALAWLIRQPRGRLLVVNGFMSRFGLLLVIIIGAQAALSLVRQPSIVRRSGLIRELATPLRTLGALPSRNVPLRDIYLVVLDGHANARVLGEVFGFDNSRFEDSLRSLGFYVPRDVRSNYVQTYLSVSSLLNFSHVTKLTRDAGEASKDHSLPTYLVKHNRAARFLKSQGYKYVLFPSAWWAATANSPLADEEFDPLHGFDLRHELQRTELRLAVLRSTLLRLAFLSDETSTPLVQHFIRSFRGLGDVAADPTPTFAFAHILLPHVPYLLDERCRPLEHPIPDDMEADTPEQRRDYVAQVKCVDHLVLELVTALLRRSPTPPVILLVGDHGPRFADVGFYEHPERVSPAFIRERFGAFGAFYLPEDGARAFEEPVTLVNVVGNVLRYYFNADVPPSANQLYVSGEELYRFYPVERPLGTR